MDVARLFCSLGCSIFEMRCCGMCLSVCFPFRFDFPSAFGVCCVCVRVCVVVPVSARMSTTRYHMGMRGMQRPVEDSPSKKTADTKEKGSTDQVVLMTNFSSVIGYQ